MRCLLLGSVKSWAVLFLLGAWALSAQPTVAQPPTLTGWFTFVVADYPSEAGLISETTYVLTEDSGARHELLIDIDLMQPLGGPVALNRKRVTVDGEWEQSGLDVPARFRVSSIELAVSLHETSIFSHQRLATVLSNADVVELEPLACSLEESLVSEGGGQHTTIVFDNQTSEPRYVSWVDYAGQRVLHATLRLGESYTQQTYAGHVWVVTDEESRCLSIHKAVAAPGKVTLCCKEPLSGSQAWVTILCRFADATHVTPHPVSHYEKLMGLSYPGLGHYWNEVSDGNVPDLAGSVVVGWYNLPHPRSYYATSRPAPIVRDGDLYDYDLEKTAADCTAAADADVFFPDFDGFTIVFNQDFDPPIGNLARGGSHFLTLDGQQRFWGVTWMPPKYQPHQATWAHEMGHALGLQHSSGPYGQDDPPFSPTTYDSQWDVMSSGGSCMFPDPRYGCVGAHTIAYHKDFLGWIPADRKYVAPPDTTRTILLERLAQPGAEGYLMAQVPIGDSPTDFYTVEARLFAGYDEEIPDEAVVIHKVDTTLADRLAQVVDIDNNGDPNDEGAMWTVGEIFTDLESNLQVSIDAAYTTGYRVTINTDPATFSTCIDFLSASSHFLGPGRDGASVQVEAASDCDWSASSNTNWIRVTAGARSNGQGRVSYTVTRNPRSAARIGTLTIGGWTFTVTQAGAAEVLFEDDMESGTEGWWAASPWAQTMASARSGLRAWTDSPGGHYQNDQNSGLWSPVIDLTEVESATLTFWHRYDIASDDQGSVWVVALPQQEDGSWQTEKHLRTFTGTNPTWQQTSIDLTPFVGESIRLAFYLWSDAAQTADGWYIDDVAVFSSDFDTPPPPQARLENPSPGSFQSGIGIISGWACEAQEIVIELAGTPVPAAYGTPRGDTRSVCGDSNNGFSLLVNWNNLGLGEHPVRTLVDGVEFARTTVRVTTLGVEFLRGVSGTFPLSGFPHPGETTVVRWNEAQQNFVITDGQPDRGGGHDRVAGLQAALENPSLGSSQSGIGIISGWACAVQEIVIELAGTPVPAAYGTPRGDTQRVCGDSNNGFVLLVNWNNLGPGEHEIRALADGAEFARTTVRVTTLGVEFLRGVSGTFPLADFPHPGETTTLRWEESLQNFVIIP